MKFRKSLIHAMALLLALLPFLGMFARETSAATSRVAVIKEMTGTVQVKKAGGSKQFKAFARMSLNEGDVLTTGASSTAVLQFANGSSEDDKMSVAANTTLTFSKLSDRSGTRTKVSMFNGTAWVDVKSITSKNDEFTLETPTAIMGVRGTHLLVAVDPDTGATRLTVAAGVVSTRSTGKAEAPMNVKPGDNALITKDAQNNGDITIAPTDLQQLVAQSDKSIIEAIVAAAGDIVKENTERLDTYFQDDTTQPPSETARKKSNVENLLGAIVDNAIKSGLITEERASQLITEAETKAGVKVDLTKKTQQLSDEEKKRQEEQRKKEEEARKLAEAELKRKEEERNKNEELQKKIDAARKEKEDANKKAEEEKKRKAEEAYQKLLDDGAREKFLKDKEEADRKAKEAQEAANKKAAEDAARKAGASPTATATGGTSTPPPSGSTTPPPPVLSSNADLNGLAVSPGTLTPAFAAATTNYTLTVAHDVTSLTVTPTTADAKAAFTVAGHTNLAVGANTVTVVVTAENGTTKKTYTISVTREASSSIVDVSQIAFTGLSGSFAFDPSVHEKTVEAAAATSAVTLTVTPTDSQSTVNVTVNGTSVSRDAATDMYTALLTETVTDIIVRVTASNGVDHNVYMYHVIRGKNTNADATVSKLDLAYRDDYGFWNKLVYMIDPNRKNAYLSFANEWAHIRFKPVPTMAASSWSLYKYDAGVSGSATKLEPSADGYYHFDLGVGDNGYRLEILAPDGQSRMSYDVNFNVQERISLPYGVTKISSGNQDWQAVGLGQFALHDAAVVSSFPLDLTFADAAVTAKLFRPGEEPQYPDTQGTPLRTWTASGSQTVPAESGYNYYALYIYENGQLRSAYSLLYINGPEQAAWTWIGMLSLDEDTNLYPQANGDFAGSVPIDAATAALQVHASSPYYKVFLNGDQVMPVERDSDFSYSEYVYPLTGLTEGLNDVRFEVHDLAGLFVREHRLALYRGEMPGPELSDIRFLSNGAPVPEFKTFDPEQDEEMPVEDLGYATDHVTMKVYKQDPGANVEVRLDGEVINKEITDAGTSVETYELDIPNTVHVIEVVSSFGAEQVRYQYTVNRRYLEGEAARNAALEELEFGDPEMNPIYFYFDSDQTYYELTLPYSASSLPISALPSVNWVPDNGPTATVSDILLDGTALDLSRVSDWPEVTTSASLSEGSHKLEIRVVSADGSVTQSYRVALTRLGLTPIPALLQGWTMTAGGTGAAVSWSPVDTGMFQTIVDESVDTLKLKLDFDDTKYAVTLVPSYRGPYELNVAAPVPAAMVWETSGQTLSVPLQVGANTFELSVVPKGTEDGDYGYVSRSLLNVFRGDVLFAVEAVQEPEPDFRYTYVGAKVDVDTFLVHAEPTGTVKLRFYTAEGFNSLYPFQIAGEHVLSATKSPLYGHSYEIAWDPAETVQTWTVTVVDAYGHAMKSYRLTVNAISAAGIGVTGLEVKHGDTEADVYPYPDNDPYEFDIELGSEMNPVDIIPALKPGSAAELYRNGVKAEAMTGIEIPYGESEWDLVVHPADPSAPQGTRIYTLYIDRKLPDAALTDIVLNGSSLYEEGKTVYEVELAAGTDTAPLVLTTNVNTGDWQVDVYHPNSTYGYTQHENNGVYYIPLLPGLNRVVIQSWRPYQTYEIAIAVPDAGDTSLHTIFAHAGESASLTISLADTDIRMINVASGSVELEIPHFAAQTLHVWREHADGSSEGEAAVEPAGGMYPIALYDDEPTHVKIEVTAPNGNDASIYTLVLNPVPDVSLTDAANWSYRTSSSPDTDVPIVWTPSPLGVGRSYALLPDDAESAQFVWPVDAKIQVYSVYYAFNQEQDPQGPMSYRFTQLHPGYNTIEVSGEDSTALPSTGVVSRVWIIIGEAYQKLEPTLSAQHGSESSVALTLDVPTMTYTLASSLAAGDQVSLSVGGLDAYNQYYFFYEEGAETEANSFMIGNRYTLKVNDAAGREVVYTIQL